jgi:hypothetical protein
MSDGPLRRGDVEFRSGEMLNVLRTAASSGRREHRDNQNGKRRHPDHEALHRASPSGDTLAPNSRG